MTYEQLMSVLEGCRKQKTYFDTLEAERAEVLHRLTSIKAMRYDKPHVSSSAVSDISAKLAAVEGEMRRYEAKLADSLEMMQALKKDAMAAIDLCETPEQRAVMIMRYIQNLSWEKIQDKMKYASRHPFRIRNRAVDVILKKLNQK